MGQIEQISRVVGIRLPRGVLAANKNRKMKKTVPITTPSKARRITIEYGEDATFSPELKALLDSSEIPPATQLTKPDSESVSDATVASISTERRCTQ